MHRARAPRSGSPPARTYRARARSSNRSSSIAAITFSGSRSRTRFTASSRSCLRPVPVALYGLGQTPRSGSNEIRRVEVLRQRTTLQQRLHLGSPLRRTPLLQNSVVPLPIERATCLCRLRVRAQHRRSGLPQSMQRLCVLQLVSSFQGNSQSELSMKFSQVIGEQFILLGTGVEFAALLHGIRRKDRSFCARSARFASELRFGTLRLLERSLRLTSCLGISRMSIWRNLLRTLAFTSRRWSNLTPSQTLTRPSRI